MQTSPAYTLGAAPPSSPSQNRRLQVNPDAPGLSLGRGPSPGKGCEGPCLGRQMPPCRQNVPGDREACSVVLTSSPTRGKQKEAWAGATASLVLTPTETAPRFIHVFPGHLDFIFCGNLWEPLPHCTVLSSLICRNLHVSWTLKTKLGLCPVHISARYAPPSGSSAVPSGTHLHQYR